MKTFLLQVTAVLACSTGMLVAQTSGAGTITGSVKDPSGASIPAADIAVRNTDTGIDRALQTNDAGLYLAPFVQPGHYEVTASKAGFGKVIRKDLTVQVGQTLTIDFNLAVQQTSDAVTVEGLTSIVDPDKTEMSQVISTAGVQNLPIAGRRWETFALLTPNTTTDGGSGLISYRGISGLYNTTSVDGANNNQAFFSEAKGRTGVPYVYSMDSIQEFQVTAANYSAEFGQAAGGVINAVTKSGTNMLHGDLFYYLRYPTLNALDPIQKANGNFTQPVKQQQQFGGSVGGPAIKDKLFYFFTYDGSRKISPISYTSSARFPQACPAAVSATACANANGYFQSLLGAFPRFANQDVAFGKLDYQINAKNHVNASLNFNNFKAPNYYNTAITAANNSVTANGTNVTHTRIFVSSLDTTFSSNVFNTVRFQWSRDLEVTAANGTAPSVSVTNVMAYGMPNALPRPAFPDEHRIQVNDILSVTRGKHTLKAGVDFNFIHELLINLFQGGGVYSYQGGSAFGNWVADVTGTNLGDNLTGRHFTTFVQVTDPVTGVGKDDFYNNDYAWFIEDSWKAKRNLTFHIGVRYDVQTIPQPPQPNLATPLTKLYTSTINIDKNNFAPRLGMAYDMGKGGVLRAGYGMFYAKTTNSTYYATRAENGVIQQTFNCTPTSCPALTFPNLIFTPPGGKPVAPFNGALTPTVTPFTPPALTQTTRGQSPDWVNPLVHEGELNYEKALTGKMSISAGYVFSRALRLPMFIDSNLQPASTTRTYDVTSSTGATQSTVTVPYYTSRIDPTGSILTGYSDINSWYNSMVLTFRRSMSKGVEFTFNYTLSKAFDGGQVAGNGGTFNGTDLALDPKNKKLEYALSDLDQRHRFVGSVVWQPQFTSKIQNKGLKLLADGFNFSLISVFASGQPVTGQINGVPAGGPDGGVTGGLVNNSGTGTGGRIPTMPRSSFTGPGYQNFDFRIGRQFSFMERYRLSLVGEAFNLFNHTNIYSVNSTYFNYSAAGSGVCAGHTNGCLALNPAFFAPLTSNNNLTGARQLQISARFQF